MRRRGARLSRRAALLGLGAAGGALLAGCAPLPFGRPPPTAVKVHRVGWVGISTALSAVPLAVFRQALGELGYVEGQNLVIEYRWGEGSGARLRELAVELVDLPVEVLVVPGLLNARDAHEASTTVPIVMAGPGDLVAAGLAASYARSGELGGAARQPLLSADPPPGAPPPHTPGR